MGKRMVIALLVFSSIAKVRAQSGEIKAYLQQIAAYEVYIKDAKKGYGIVENGIHTVSSIKNGTFSLHSAFFGSLEAINPSIKSDAEVAEIILLQISIVKNFQSAISSLQKSGQMHSDELTYMGQVYSTVVNAGLQDVQALTVLVTAGNYSMNDGERLRQIHGLYSDMSDKYTFSQSFVAKAQALGQARAADESDIDEVSALYRINMVGL